MARPSGPAPDPGRARRNKDPRLSLGDGEWTSVDPSPNDGPIPDIPDWASPTDRTREVYYFLAGLPQAKTWSAGEWFQLWIVLPLLERYFQKPGSEGLKAIMGLINGGLHLTIEDMYRARMVFSKPEPEEVLEESARAKVVDLEARKNRLMGGGEAVNG